MKLLTEYSVKHAVTAYMFIVMLAIGGLAAYDGLPREAAPEIEIPVVLVTTPYIGVSPVDIESLVTTPLERELTEIKGIKVMSSTSAEGASIISIEFTPDTNLDEALSKVREKVDLAKADLPEDAEDPIIQEISTADFPMMIINVTAPYSIVELRKVAEDLQDRLDAVRGVLDVKLAGGVEREFQVRVDPSRLDFYGIGLHDVVNAIKNENLNLPGGDVKVGEASFLVRVPGEYRNAEQIAETVVKLRRDHPVYVRDVATVLDTFKERDTLSRLDGRNNVSLTVTKRGGENIIRIAEDLRALIAERLPRMPEGTEVIILGDSSKDIRDMVHELENNMVSGLVLVVGVIMVAMGLRNSLLIGTAIPLSMLVTFLTLSAMGITLNMVVLFSLILALGMLVDNAIVIVENIYRHHAEGKPLQRAVLEGTGEVAWPVTTSTLTTVFAFAPLLMWPNVEGKFMSFLPKTVIIVLTASLFVALTVTPVLCASFLKLKGNMRALSDDDVQHSRDTLSGRWLERYRDALRWSIARRWLVVGLGAVVFVGTFVVFGASKLGVQFFPETTPRKIIISVDAGDGARLEATDGIVRRIEAIIGGNPNIAHYVADVGKQNSGNMIFSTQGVAHQGSVSIDFIDEELQTESPDVIIERIREAVADIAGAHIEIKKEKMGPPGGAPIEIEIKGADFLALGKLSQQIRDHIASVPGLVDLTDDFQSGRPEIRIEVDRERARALNAGTGLIANTVRTAINGTEASVIRDGEDEYDITVRLDEAYRDDLAAIEALRVNVASRTNPDKTYLIPIREVADIVPAGGTGSIRHKDRDRLVKIAGNAEGRLVDEVLQDIQAKLADFELPEGYSLTYAGELARRGESQSFLGNAFLIALFLIALVLVTQFNSVILPSIILASVVLSLVGVLWGQIITRMPFGIIMTGLGVISLAGIVVNNAIVLIDYVQQLRAGGLARDEALVRAGMTRLRPVLLTAITTVLGLAPMAMGVSIDFINFSVQVGGRSAEFWKPMAIAVSFGLAVATVLTLVVVPVLYSLFDDFEQWLGRVVLRRKAAKHGAGTSAQPAPSAPLE